MKTKKTLLVIDDDENSRILVKKIVENAGYNFIGTSNLTEDKERIKESSPHLLILDLKLDGESGLNFLLEREQSAVLSKIPVLVLTQVNKDKVLKNILSFKSTDYLLKPIQSSLLLQKIRKNLKQVETRKYIFKKHSRPILKSTMPGELSKISEVAILIESPIKINDELQMKIESELLNELKINSTNVLVNKKSTSGVEGGYQTEVVLLGVTEESAQRIRKIRRLKE